MSRRSSTAFKVQVQKINTYGMLIRHLESGGIRILLYGGNAIFYHLRPSEYASTLTLLAEAAGPDTVVIPSAGPSYGVSMDQAVIARDFPFFFVYPFHLL